MNVTVVVGNPKARSRTYEAAHLVAEKLAGQTADLSVDLVDLGAALLDWSDARVADLVTAVKASDLAVFASPTYKATYTGLLKLFLDRIPGGALADVTAVPVMLGGHWQHAMACDLLLKPVLVELGATCPARGLFLLESEYAGGETLDAWLERARPQVLAALKRGASRPHPDRLRLPPQDGDFSVARPCRPGTSARSTRSGDPRSARAEP